MQDKIDVIIPTCDLYRNITLPVLFSMQKYYSTMGKGIIVGYQRPDFTLPPNFEFVSVGVDKTPAQWTNGLKRFIEGYTKDHFILHMDDHLLVDYVDGEKIVQLSKLFQQDRSIDKIMLHPFTSTMFTPYPTTHDGLLLYRCERGIGATTLMNAIWRRDYLLELLADNLSPHDFENQNNHNEYAGKTILSTHNRIMMVTSLMNRGRRNRAWHICARSEFVYAVNDDDYIARINALMDEVCPRDGWPLLRNSLNIQGGNVPERQCGGGDSASPNEISDVTIMIPSHRPQLVKNVISSLSPLNATHWDGTNYPSFSKLMNDCIVNSPTEIVIVCSDKVAPTPAHIHKMLSLLNEGYALVGLYFFACVAFTKQLVREIGFFDERFIGGECEDADFVVRMREADVAFYFTKEVPYTPMASSWNNALSRQHFVRKWGTIHMADAIRQLPEETYPYTLGPSTNRAFLPASRSFDG